MQVSEWVKQFVSILEYMRLLVRLDAWLAHTGRRMQVGQASRRVRILPNGGGIGLLTRLCCFVLCARQ